MGIKGKNQSEVERFQNWKYWDIFQSKLDQYPEGQRLEQIREIIESCKTEVENRAKKNDKDVGQVRSSVAGRYFQAIVAIETADAASEAGYRILFDPELQDIPGLGGASLDFSGSEIEPDTDLVYYQPENSTPVYVFSCKTSLRERLAQTGMWKIFFEMGGYNCKDPDCPTHSYRFAGDIERNVSLGFITMDWYNEVSSNSIVDVLDLGYTANSDGVDSENGIYPIEMMPEHILENWGL